MTIMNRQQLLAKAKKLQEQCNSESMKRLTIEKSKDFLAAQADIDSANETIREIMKEVSEIQARQAEMLATVPDSRQELVAVKQEIMQLMELEGVEGYSEDGINVSGKYSEKRGVDGSKLLSVLDGDIDEFMRIVSVTQKAIKDYAAEHANIKKELLQCIRLESRELEDVDISLLEEQ